MSEDLWEKMCTNFYGLQHNKQKDQRTILKDFGKRGRGELGFGFLILLLRIKDARWKNSI